MEGVQEYRREYRKGHRREGVQGTGGRGVQEGGGEVQEGREYRRVVAST